MFISLLIRLSPVLLGLVCFCTSTFKVDITLAKDRNLTNYIDEQLKALFEREKCYDPQKSYENDGFAGAYKLLLESQESQEGFKKALEMFGLAMSKARSSVNSYNNSSQPRKAKSEITTYFNFYCQDSDIIEMTNLHIFSSAEELRSLNFTNQTHLLFIVNGWRSTLTRSEKVKDLYLKEADKILTESSSNKLCVVLVDWRAISMDINYFSIVMRKLDLVALDMFSIVRQIRTSNPNVDFDGRKTSCLGHSLGAQICGRYGKLFKGLAHNILGLGMYQ